MSASRPSTVRHDRFAAGSTRPRGAERVLLVTNYFEHHRGGLEIVAGQLVRHLLALRPDLEVEWVASASPGATSIDGVIVSPVATWNVTEDRLGVPYPLWSPRRLWQLGRKVAGADVVHIHDSLYVANVAAWAWARWHGRPVVVTQHIGEVPYESAVLRRLLWLANHTLARAVLCHSDQVVFISPRVQRFFARTFGRPVGEVVANGVDTAVFSPSLPGERDELRRQLGWSTDRRVLLFVGRFVEKKGVAFLRRVAERRPQDLFVFIGWGPLDPTGWHLPNVVVVPPTPQAELPPYYRAADALVLPSVGEGFPLVVQEALACGTPALVSTETGEGAPYHLRGLQPLALDVAAWDAAISSIAVNDHASRASGARAGTPADWTDVAQYYLDRFDDVVATGRRQQRGSTMRQPRRSQRTSSGRRP